MFDFSLRAGQLASRFGHDGSVRYWQDPAGSGPESNPVDLRGAIVDDERAEVELRETATSGEVKVRMRAIRVVVDRASPMFCGVERFDDRGMIEIDGRTYAIESITEGDGTAGIDLKREAAFELSKGGYRR